MKKFLATICVASFLISGCGDNSAAVNDTSKSAPKASAEVENTSNSAQASTINFELHESIGSVSARWLSQEKKFTMKLEGYTRLDGDLSKGAAVFDDELYFHFDCANEKSGFGGSNAADAIPVYVFEGLTQIRPVTCNDGRKFWLLMTETGGGGTANLVGERKDGKWVSYFEERYLTTMKKLREMYQVNLGEDYEFRKLYAEDDAIVFYYEQMKTKKVCLIVYKWDDATESFNSEVVPQ